MTRTRRRRGRKRATGKPGQEQVSAAAFKATCLKLMDCVRETGTEYVITKHGTPVARLVPYTSSERQSLFGSMKGTVIGYERPFEPVDGVYDIDRD